MGNAGRQLGTDRREVGDFRKVASTICVAAAVWIGVVGCAYPVHQRASGWLVVEPRRIPLRTSIDRGAAVRLASEMQRSDDVLARHALSGCSRRCSWRQAG
jgi:hypothetical protein